MTLIVREIRDMSDPLWDQWWAVYLGSFPENERMSEAHFRKVLSRKRKQEAKREYAFVAVEHESHAVGIAYLKSCLEGQVVELWYIAVRADSRGAGIGTALFRQTVELVKDTFPACQFLAFEVDLPSDKEPVNVRRIEWYRRLGAKYLKGIQYFQTVDDDTIPPVEMGLMVYLFSERNVSDVFKSLKQIHNGQLKQTSRELELV
jgi:GNAT superfamily N-acetyltransferase